MSAIQRFFLRILPRAWAEEMRAESMSWHYHCDECGHARSVWSMGGIRWKAKGERKANAACPQCGKLTWHTLRRDENVAAG